MDHACLPEYDSRRVQLHCGFSAGFSFGNDGIFLYDSGTGYQDSDKTWTDLHSECGLCIALLGIDTLELL